MSQWGDRDQDFDPPQYHKHYGVCCGIFCASCGKCWELRHDKKLPIMACSCDDAQELAFRYLLNECNPAGSPPGFSEGEHSKDERTKT